MRNILVGSDGFVGTNLKARENHEYHSFDNGFLKKELDAETIFADITGDMSTIEACFKESEGNFRVINLATNPSHTVLQHARPRRRW